MNHYYNKKFYENQRIEYFANKKSSTMGWCQGGLVFGGSNTHHFECFNVIIYETTEGITI